MPLPRYWLQFDDLDFNEVLSRHKRSREGDWLYPVERNCRYLDMSKECPKMTEQKATGLFYVALAIIKMRIVAIDNAITKELDYVFQQTNAKRIQEIRPIVREG